MFVGHLAVGLAAKRVQPKIPLGVLVAASFGIDLVWPLLVLAGVEVVRVDPPAAELYGGCRSGAVDMALAVLGAVDRAAGAETTAQDIFRLAFPG